MQLNETMILGAAKGTKLEHAIDELRRPKTSCYICKS